VRRLLNDRSRIIFGVGVFLAIAYCLATYFINAWVTEDAYITFRSVEQLFIGNGPRWNPHERVQAFTHPLWFFVLAGSRLLTADMFLNSIVIGCLLSLVTLLILLRFSREKSIGLALMVALFSSKAFVDFSSSGLENALSHFIIVVFYTLFFVSIKRGPSRARLLASVCIFSLGLCNRHDLVFLTVIPLVFLMWQGRILFRQHRFLILSTIVAASPFALWTAFSLLYYGFLLPNTAYAKLNTGISFQESFLQGLTYLKSSFVGDPILGLVTGAALAVGCLPKVTVDLRLPALSILVNLIYVAKVGGDFMQGRFLTSSFLVAVLIISQYVVQRPSFLALSVLLLGYNLSFQKAPIWTNEAYKVSGVPPSGVVDEKGFYFESLSFYQYVRASREHLDFPKHRFRDDIIKHRQEQVLVRGNIGLIGYYAGLDQIIIDYHALSDPFLARITDLYSKRIGHFVRVMPEGYEDTVKNGQNLLVDPSHRELYEEIKMITQDPLWSPGRWQAILKMNLRF
jgi:arabinofuranosyltransferase